MKIAIVYDAIYPYVKGGGEKRIYELSKILSKKHEIHLFGMKYWNGNNVIKRDNVYLHGVFNSISLYNKKGNRSLLQPFRFSFYLFKELMKYDFDLVDCQNFPYIPCFICKLYSKIKNKPFIITWLEVWNDNWNKYGLFGYIGKFIERISFRLTKNNIVLSDNMTKIIKESIVIPAGVDLKKINKIKKRKDKFDILFVGRLIKEKNVDFIIRSVDRNIKVGIIGDGPERENLINLVKKLNLRNIKFFGFLDEDEEVYSYMKSSKILVLPSIREGFGIVILEALACGCKVIATNHKNNNAKYLADKNFISETNIKSLRNKIKYGLKNKYNNNINLEDFDINKISKELENYYQRCINEI